MFKLSGAPGIIVSVTIVCAFIFDVVFIDELQQFLDGVCGIGSMRGNLML